MERAFAITALLALAGCSGVSYNYDFDPGADFAGYQTYLWVEPGEDLGPNPRGVDQLSERRIMQAVDGQMAAKGYRKIERGQPDFALNFVVTTQQNVDYTTYHTGWGYGGGWYRGGAGMATSRTTATEWTEGTLILDVYDAGARELVWRGTATAEIRESQSPEERNQRINEVVAKMLERYPPQS
ncbi:MAG: DUF4136 domain-containing protein [Gemmatimonadota bacterium]|nr:MAG: DUF4136 domain-containing protein [Gemmatimonadota bacterium]